MTEELRIGQHGQQRGSEYQTQQATLAHRDRHRNEKMKGRNSVKDGWKPGKGK